MSKRFTEKRECVMTAQRTTNLDSCNQNLVSLCDERSSSAMFTGTCSTAHTMQVVNRVQWEIKQNHVINLGERGASQEERKGKERRGERRTMVVSRPLEAISVQTKMEHFPSTKASHASARF